MIALVPADWQLPVGLAKAGLPEYDMPAIRWSTKRPWMME
jgi:hypothetical protein